MRVGDPMFSRPLPEPEPFVPERPAWMADANCLGVDPDLMFPERGASLAPAKDVCRGCEVRSECLAFALDTGEKFGVWGGLSERERRRLRRMRGTGRRDTLADRILALRAAGMAPRDIIAETRAPPGYVYNLVGGEAS